MTPAQTQYQVLSWLFREDPGFERLGLIVARNGHFPKPHEIKAGIMAAAERDTARGVRTIHLRPSVGPARV